MANLVTPMALRVAVTLGLPDLLAEPRDAGPLAAELDVSPLALDLLLGHLVTLGVLERTGGGYRTTPFGAHLRRDADNGLANLMDAGTAAGRADLAFVDLLHSVKTGEPAYPLRYGQDFWSDLDDHPHLRAAFDGQMAFRIREQLPQVVAGFDWARFATIVDVGGGPGRQLAAILAAHPRVRGHLVDLDVAAARTALAPLGERAQATAGSFFDPLPPGADAYLLFDVLHDWDDEHAERVLRRCAEAMPDDGRVLVVEAVGGLGAATEMDLVMLVHFGGRERRVEELEQVAGASGLVLDRVVELTRSRHLLEFRKGVVTR
ncbi:methyltransferase [Nocardia sp. NRRL S-836]|uniref:methyltransferase n=1 Tax=Nocardia sp. NRRL S-836 TaxID=1519492 RepID=UPI0006ADE0CF|nr:methyltransferase [Nocardia sp. NRRL S-836]KOV88303.1 methyltransferase [Nocardia sp. NRRL S-836]